MSSNQPQGDGNSPNRGLIAAIMSVPSAIFNQGADHGRQWRDKAEGDNEGRDRWNACKRRRSQEPALTKAPTQPEAGSMEGEEWFNQVAKEFEKREQFAKELYDSWNPMDQSSTPKKSTSFNNSSQSTSSTLPSSFPSTIPDVEQTFDRLWSWAKRPDSMTTSSEDTLFHQLFDLTSNLENEIPQRLAFSGLGFPFIGRKLDPFLNDSIACGYSPLQLEQQEGFDNTWRVRFEDLVRVTNEQPMLNTEEADKVKRQTWSRWLVDFQTRNVIPDQLNKSSGCPKGNRKQESSKVTPWNHEERNMKELAKDAWRRKKEESQDTDTQGSKSWFQMSSVVETRNSHTNPDGSVTTNINIVKRLPDGRVEKSERSETTPIPTKAIEDPVTRQSPQQRDESSRKGWFWSR